MRLLKLRYTLDTKDALPELKALSARSPFGCEIHVRCLLDPGNADCVLWAGSDEAGVLCAAVLRNGPVQTWLTPKGGAAARLTDETEGFFAPPRRRTLFAAMAAAPEETAPAGVRRDPEAVWALYRTLWNGPPPPGAEARAVLFLRAANAGLADCFWIEDKAGKLAAGAQIRAANETNALIANLFTRPACRGRGYATRLLAACGTAAAEKGRTPVLYCEKKLRRFYAARGYREIPYRGL